MIWIVLLGVALLGGAAGVAGSFAVLRQRALVGDLLSHAALPGLAAAYLIVGGRSLPVLLAGALTTGLASVACVTAITRHTRIKEDAAIGIALSTFFAAGIVLLSIVARLPEGSGKAGLETYIYGQAAGIQQRDIYWIAGVSGVALTLAALFFKEFKTFSFDAPFAASLGWPVALLDLLMMGLLACVTVVGLQAVGVVLMAALLIIPAATARFWTQRLETMLALAAAIGAFIGPVGVILSSGVWWMNQASTEIVKGLPTGPAIVLTGAAIFLASVLVAPGRGVLALLWTRFRLSRKVARENLLRSLYELSETNLPSLSLIARCALAAERAMPEGKFARLLAELNRERLVEAQGTSVRLTAAGLDEAALLTRRHRLWELFLIQGAGVAADHVDRDADAVEHVLPAALLKSLEKELAAMGRLPALSSAMPDSPHGPHRESAAGGSHADAL